MDKEKSLDIMKDPGELTPVVLPPVRRFFELSIPEKMAQPAPTSIRSKAAQMSLLRDQLLVRPCTKEEQTAGGIFIPERAQEGQIEGIVVVAGPGRYTENGMFIPNDVLVNDRVLYGKFAGIEYKLHDQSVRLITSADVIGIIR
jgi:chaperonin GroES